MLQLLKKHQKPLYSELFLAKMGAKSFAASLLYFLELKERLKEAPFRALENKAVMQKLVAYSWISS
ncbi:hypothetical protein [Flavobacterium sp. ZT3P35]|uniref:hypothetical protein n=1 Tax=Flavobacterium sp. ZT3P35 TaxID=3401727 RepID=UPI003AAD31A7